MIAIYVDNYERATFFLRVAQASQKESYFFTTKHSVYNFLSKHCQFVFLISKESDVTEIESLSNTQELTYVHRGTQSQEHAKFIYRNVLQYLKKLSLPIKQFRLALVFNGNSASQKAFVKFFADHGIGSMFSEISNLPNKVLFDAQGVNAKSILYKSPSILEKLPSVEDDVHSKWIHEYEEYKKSPIPQGKLKGVFIKAYIGDYLYSLLGKGLREENLMNPFIKIMTTLSLSKSKKSLSLSTDSYDLSTDYVFFPTQVRFDSQLILNSDVNNEQAIRKAAEIANERNCQLYVKVHPAETDVEMLKRYQVLRNELNFKLVDANTTELIKRANKIVTINSTVGLEALIYNKPLTVLGRAIYTNFNYELMKKYIHSYLVNCDYFSEQPISSSEFNKITNLLEVSNLVEKG
jgi:capsular polysaccharide export protein